MHSYLLKTTLHYTVIEKMDVLIHLVSSLNWTYVGPCVIVTALLYYWYHRPRKFPPGPRGFPIIGVVPLVPKYLERSLTKWSKEYGPVMSVRLGGRDVVTLNDYESIHEVKLGHFITNLLKPV